MLSVTVTLSVMVLQAWHLGAAVGVAVGRLGAWMVEYEIIVL